MTPEQIAAFQKAVAEQSAADAKVAESKKALEFYERQLAKRQAVAKAAADHVAKLAAGLAQPAAGGLPAKK